MFDERKKIDAAGSVIFFFCVCVIFVMNCIFLITPFGKTPKLVYDFFPLNLFCLEKYIRTVWACRYLWDITWFSSSSVKAKSSIDI